MKVLMINDCAYVGETILKFLPGHIEKAHIRRSRGLWSKTVGLALKILGARGDIYHVNYLLQDCYIASRLGKRPLIGHAHGSDLRAGLRHFLWRRIVRHNLKQCDKILVSTPDLLDLARGHREDTEYLPSPVDTQLFYPKPPPDRASGSKLRVLIASNSDWAVKGTDIALRALGRLRDRADVYIIRAGRDFDRTLKLAASLGLGLRVLEPVPHDIMREYYWASDVVIDQFKLGALGMVSLEAIACGRPAISYVSSNYQEYRDFPLKDLRDEEEVAEAIASASATLWQKQYAYIQENHAPETVLPRLLKIYEELKQS